MPALIIIIALFPSFAWLSFYLHEDFRHPEPRMLVALTFLLGGISTFLVLPVQIGLQGLLAHFGADSYSAFGLWLAAGTEEIAKWSMVYFFIRQTKAFQFEPIHAMIYMTISGLGFAAIENIGTLLRASDGSLLNIISLETIILRFIGANLLHSLSCGIVGYFWARAIAFGKRVGPAIVLALLVATTLHAAFNFLILKTGPVSFTIPLLIIASFFVLNDFEILKKYERM